VKGLNSLIPQKKRYDQNSFKKESVFLIDIGQIKPNPYQPRRDFDVEGLKELADSIRVYGILQPLVVTKVEEDVPTGRSVSYELIAGERRLRAAKMANLPSVPVVVRTSTPKEKLEASLIENLQRNDLGAVEEARAFKQLYDEFGIKQKQIALRIGKSESYVANTMRILALPQNMQKALGQGKISEGHTRPLLALQNTPEQEKLFKEIQERGLNVRQAETRGRELGSGKPRFAQGKTSVDSELLELLEAFKDAHNISEARVRTDGRKARLAVHFSSKNDLRNWIKKLLA
jgi:ParB family chromosome partitioning protein